MTTILAIDSATGPCSVAVWRDGKIAAYAENIKPVMQSASLLPMIEDALTQSHIEYKDLSAVACTVGPGSFTGIRVGLSAAQGIAFAAKIKSLGFSTLEVLAFAARDKADQILAILNAGKGEVYYQQYETKPAWKASYEARLGIIEAAGTSAFITSNIGANTISFPRADALAQLAATRPEYALSLKPFYIRAPDAKLPQSKLLGF